MTRKGRTIVALLVVACILPCLSWGTSPFSLLWGKAGERWTPEGRLPDFSFAGYHEGEIPPATSSKTEVNVRDFGAKGDGQHDDIEAFRKALDTMDEGILLVPPGRYLLGDILWIKKSGIVLRGAGADQSILFFPKTLETVRPNPSSTTSGRATSGYSWSGGFVWVKGYVALNFLGHITENAPRGTQVLVLEKPLSLKVGQRVCIEQTDDSEKTLARHLYSEDPGDISNIKKPIRLRFVARVSALEGNRLFLDRPLRTDVRKSWNPVLKSYAPSVEEVGIESLGFEFPVTAYHGHFTEEGRNALAFTGASDCWVRNICIRNADSGIFLSGSRFCSLHGVVFESKRPQAKKCTGHHGIEFGHDCLLENFDFKTHFIHDISMGYLADGNVVKNGKGINLSLDHHKMANHDNLFANLTREKEQKYGAVAEEMPSENIVEHAVHSGGFPPKLQSLGLRQNLVPIL
jgi:hypothetical protein